MFDTKQHDHDTTDHEGEHDQEPSADQHPGRDCPVCDTPWDPKTGRSSQADGDEFPTWIAGCGHWWIYDPATNSGVAGHVSGPISLFAHFMREEIGKDAGVSPV